MAAPAYRNTGAYTTGIANSVGADIPTGAANDIIVVFLYIENTDAITPAAGYAEAANSPSPTALPGGTRLHVFWKRATSGDDAGGTATFNWTNSIYRVTTVSRYTGAATSGDPWDVTGSSATSALNVSPPAITLTTTGADRLLVYSATSFNSTAWTPPAGFTERVDQGSNDVTVDDLAQPVAGSTGSVAGSSGSGTHSAWLGALMPPSSSLPATVRQPYTSRRRAANW